MSKDEQLYSDVNEIKDCLIGNPMRNQKGLVKTVDDIDTRLMKLENKMHRRRGTVKLPLWIIKILGLSS